MPRQQPIDPNTRPQCNHPLLHLRMLETLHLANPHCPECRAEIDSWWDLTSERGLRVQRVPELRIGIQSPSQDEIVGENNTNVDVDGARRESPAATVTGERRNEEVIPRPSSFSRYFDSVSLVILLLGLGYCLLRKKVAWDLVFGLYSLLIWTILARE